MISNHWKGILTTIMVVIAATFFSSAQELYNPDTVLVTENGAPKVLLVGCYHFAYYNLDAHKTDDDKQVDVLSDKRQKEMEELVKYIAEFKPTKIAIESGENTHKLMEQFREYEKGKRELGRDEREQIGFRLMKQFKLDTVYGVDDESFVTDVFNSGDSSMMEFIGARFDEYDFQSEDYMDQQYAKLYALEDELKLKTSMLAYFKHMNSDKMLTLNYGSYLVGDFKLDKNRGTDALALYWYNRNLRIFSNIQKIANSESDRVVVIFGSGHVQILKQLFESSPEFELIKFNDL